MCVTHLTRSVSTCCFPLPLLFACLAWWCNCSSFSLPLTGTSKGAVFWRISGGFAPFQVFFFYLEHFHFNRSDVQKMAMQLFFLGFFGRNLWHFQVFSVSFFISFFLACVRSAIPSRAVIAEAANLVWPVFQVHCKIWRHCVTKSVSARQPCRVSVDHKKRFWCFCVLPVESLQAARVLHRWAEKRRE